VDEPREVTIHQSLVRPLLLAGAERELVLVNVTLIGALVFGVGLHWFSLSVAFLLGTAGQWALTYVAKKDPQMRLLYIRHMRYRDIYPALSGTDAKAQYIHPSIPGAV